MSQFLPTVQIIGSMSAGDVIWSQVYTVVNRWQKHTIDFLLIKASTLICEGSTVNHEVSRPFSSNK